MSSRIDDLLAHLAQLEREVEHELNRARKQWRYKVDAGRIRFERDVRLAHQRLKQSIPRFIRESSPLNLLTAPIIYAMIVPLTFLDATFSLYQALCFPIYGISHVRRSVYIVIDRQHLAYLNGIEKLNCVYCGYANGVLAYVREIAGRTEQYLVSDPSRKGREGAPYALSRVRRLRRCRGLPSATADAAGEIER